MVKKMKFALAVIFLVLSVVLINGCETATGAAKGMAYSVGSTAEGMGKDSYNFWKFIQAADNWIKKNLW